jgi:hypothetical protein
MPAVIQNCFEKCGFGTASSVSVNANEKHCEWVELQATLFGPVLSIFFSMITSLPVIN